jgi:AcrR family transcriptional regulator
MKTVMARREGNLRDVLVQEGRLMFEQAGATELSMREIARRVGVSEAAPFKHFKGKEELLAAIASSGFRELRDERMHIARDQADPLARARAMMLSYIAFARAHEGLFSLMIGPRLSAYRDGEFGEAGLESFNLFSNAIRALALEHGWPARSLELLTHMAWALEHGIATLLLSGVVPQKNSDLDVDAMCLFSVDFLLRSISEGPRPGLKVAPVKAASKTPRRTTK